MSRGVYYNEDGLLVQRAEIWDGKNKAKVDEEGKIATTTSIEVGAITATDVTIKDSADPSRKLKVNEDGSISIDDSALIERLEAIEDKLNDKIDVEVMGSYVGYSHEVKPTGKRGDEFIELDTKLIYFHDGTDWVVF